MEGFCTLFLAILGVGKLPLHQPYPYSFYDGEDEPSILGTNEMFDDIGWDCKESWNLGGFFLQFHKNRGLSQVSSGMSISKQLCLMIR